MKPPVSQRNQSTPHDQPVSDHDLSTALQQQARQQQRLHQLIWLATLILAPILSVMVAN